MYALMASSGGEVDVGRRDPVAVGDEGLGVVRVVQDHPGTTGFEDCDALGRPVDATAQTHDDLAGDARRERLSGIAQFVTEVAASTSGFMAPVPPVMLTPVAIWPLRRRTVLLKVRSWVLAPTDVTHGTEAGPPTVSAPGPELPFEVATQTLASAANRKAMSAGSVRDAPPPIE